jgi:hypothetical protein
MGDAEWSEISVKVTTGSSIRKYFEYWQGKRERTAGQSRHVKSGNLMGGDATTGES